MKEQVNPPVTFNSSRIKMGLLCVSMGGAMALVIWVSPEQPQFFNYLSVTLCGLGFLVFAVQLFPGSSYITLSREGFKYCNLFRATFVPWSQVERFMIVRVQYNELVGWVFNEGYERHKVMGRLSKFLTGAEAALPDTYGMKVSTLVELMSDFRRRYGTGFPPISAMREQGLDK